MKATWYEMLLREHLCTVLDQQQGQVMWFEVLDTPDEQAEVSARVAMSLWRDSERLSDLSNEIKRLDDEHYIHLMLL